MGTDSVIYIRTDGNSKIATGHLVRCLCIAQALETLGKKVCFLVSDKDSESLLLDLSVSIFQDYSFSLEVIILKTAIYDNLELELGELSYLLNEKSTGYRSKPVILLDSYYVTPDYLDSLREFAKIAYMDDLRAFNYNVDLVINYDVIPPSKEVEYQQAYTNASAALLGAGYTPLRRQFQNQSVALKESIQNILVTTGGSDPCHFAETVVSYLLSQNFTANLHIVIGKLFTDTEALEELSNRTPSIYLYRNISDMAALMKKCDYAISAAGTTLYELCALGIPAISFTFADNQIIMAETFAETKAVPYGGDIRQQIADISPIKNNCSQDILQTTENSSMEICTVLNCINRHLSDLMADPSKRTKQHQLMRSLVDGKGAVKIAEALLRLS